MNLIETAWAQGAAPAPQGGGLGMIWLMLLMFGLMYFLILRPQAKRAKEHTAMVQALSKGDEIVTSGGILGRIEKVDEQFLTLKVGNNTTIKVQRHTVGAVMPKGTYKD
jgi:preprotein translocase subunit YajC